MTATVTKITASCPHRKAGACGECFATVYRIAEARKERLVRRAARQKAWKRAAKGWRWIAHEASGQSNTIVRTSRPRFTR